MLLAPRQRVLSVMAAQAAAQAHYRNCGAGAIEGVRGAAGAARVRATGPTWRTDLAAPQKYAAIAAKMAQIAAVNQ